MKNAIVLAGCIAALAALPTHADAAAAKTHAPFVVRMGAAVSIGAYGEVEATEFCYGNDGLPGFFVAWPPGTKLPRDPGSINTANMKIVCYGDDGRYGHTTRAIFDHGKLSNK